MQGFYIMIDLWNHEKKCAEKHCNTKVKHSKVNNMNRSLKIHSGIAKLSQDMETLINNRQGSDIQFRLGGSPAILQENRESIYDEPATITLYAHSAILRCRSRYFATMLDEDKHWKESSCGIIYKPNISPGTFQDVLYYIYTGNISTKNSENVIELITAAEEMDLEELSTECQAELIRTVRYILLDNESDDENENEETFQDQPRERIPIDMAIRTHIIPALNLAGSHSLFHLSQTLQEVILPRISVIIKSPEAYTTFVDGISSEALLKIIASDDISMAEYDIWHLVLSWGCRQTNLLKRAVEAHLSNPDEGDDEEISNGTIISDTQLDQLKTVLTPLLPAIRFSLLDPDDYYYILAILSYFLSRRRLTELSRFFVNPYRTGQLDAPRKKNTEQRLSSNIVVESAAWKFLRKNIFETGGITGCLSLKHLKFELLFRASEHGFHATTFHQRCDDKGPTLVLVRSIDNHLFGGVNFNPWKSDNTWSSSPLNFLFALPNKYHRKNPAIFRIEDQAKAQFSAYNFGSYGPTFGNNDLHIADSANINNGSGSRLPTYYNGSGASRTALAGAHRFRVSDYEVFALSKY